MGSTYEYLKGINKADVKDKCHKSKKDESHKLATWFCEAYCERCGVKLK